MPSLDFSEEFQLVRYRNGVKLIERTDSTITNNTSELANHTVKTIQQLPISVYFDDLNNVTITSNEKSAEECGFQSATEMKGKPWYQNFKLHTLTQPLAYADETIKQEIIKISYENATRNDDSCRDVLNIRMPWYNQDNKIKGLFGCAIIIGQNPLAESLETISALGILNSSHNIQTQQLLGSELNSVYLSKREWDCLHLTIRGKTAKQIAYVLGLSPWTIQEYLTNIKLKLNVSSKSELVDKTIDFLYQKFNHCK